MHVTAANATLPSNNRLVHAQATLVIVEEAQISRLVRTVLEKRGYAVILANPVEAAAMLRAPESKIGVLLTNTPGIFLEFAEKTPLLYLSSSPDPRLASAFRACRVVRKPFVPSELAEAVGELEDA